MTKKYKLHLLSFPIKANLENSSSSSFFLSSIFWKISLLRYGIEDLPKGRILCLGEDFAFLLSLASKAGFEAHGMESSSEKAQKLLQKYNLTSSSIVVQEAKSFPFASNFFDNILILNNFSFLKEAWAWKECIRVLRPNGRLRILTYVFSPEKGALWKRLFSPFFSFQGNTALGEKETWNRTPFALKHKTALGRFRFLHRFDLCLRKSEKFYRRRSELALDL